MTYLLKNTKKRFLDYLEEEVKHIHEPLLIVTKSPAEAEELKKKLETIELNKKIYLIPNSETLPYDFFSSSNQVQNERIHILSQDLYIDNLILIVAIQTLISPAPSPSRLLNSFGKLETGLKISKHSFVNKIISQGYQKTDLVTEVGEFAERGSIIDIYLPNQLEPLRIELFGEEIETLRFFNPSNQITTKKIHVIDLVLPQEYPLDLESINLFKKNWRNTFETYEGNSEIFKSIIKQKKIQGAEIYLPFFYDGKYTPLNYIKHINTIFLVDGLFTKLKEFEELISTRYSEYSFDITRPLIAPKNLYASIRDVKDFLKNKTIIDINNSSTSTLKINEKKSKNQRQASYQINLKSLPMPGDRVVHLLHGIGIFIGLKSIDTGHEIADCLEIEFSGNSKLYVPVNFIDLISKYFGPESIKLDVLGSKKWAKRKEKALKQSFDIAAELIELQAKRKNTLGKKYNLPKGDYLDFCKGFLYEETPDQNKVIKEVEEDLKSSQPMDRLICGEVGFGKTEVALRAVFITCFNDKLSCLLVPTTLLAKQHYDTFKERFKNFGIEIEFLSRAKTEKEKENTLKKLKAGAVDLIIGTHALLQDSIELNNLGLLIIDEEHKFGVRQKEKIKKIKEDLNVLSLSATPIPRSLNLALSDLKDLSIIATAPSGRVPVNTFVHRYNENLIKEAIQRELIRGGQVYFLCNNLTLIEDRKLRLQKMFPEIIIQVGHGKMKAKDIENVMVNFQKNITSILVCSTIIESGIDIPNANTLIVESANKLGLAQLHQLRGRVGRSERQAFTYFLKDPSEIESKANARLDALIESDSLSAGFLLAIKDLEIRGAGEILGSKQSGVIESVGLEMYLRLLNKTVQHLKEGSLDRDNSFIEKRVNINLGKSAYLTSEYLPDINQRILLYSRIANALNEDELKLIQVEMIDRFGLFSKEVKALMIQSEISLLAERKNIEEINSFGSYLVIKFNGDIKKISLKKEEDTNEDFGYLIDYLKEL